MRLRLKGRVSGSSSFHLRRLESLRLYASDTFTEDEMRRQVMHVTQTETVATEHVSRGTSRGPGLGVMKLISSCVIINVS